MRRPPELRESPPRAHAAQTLTSCASGRRRDPLLERRSDGRRVAAPRLGVRVRVGLRAAVEAEVRGRREEADGHVEHRAAGADEVRRERRRRVAVLHVLGHRDVRDARAVAAVDEERLADGHLLLGPADDDRRPAHRVVDLREDLRELEQVLEELLARRARVGDRTGDHAAAEMRDAVREQHVRVGHGLDLLFEVGHDHRIVPRVAQLDRRGEREVLGHEVSFSEGCWKTLFTLLR